MIKTVCPELLVYCVCSRPLCKAAKQRKKLSDRTICDGDEYETECLIYAHAHR